MDCNELQHQLMVPYIFEECTEEEKRRVEAHTQECGRCAAVLRELLGTVSTLRAWGDEETPRRLLVLPGPRARRQRISRWLAGTGWAAAAVLAALAATRADFSYEHGALTVSFSAAGRRAAAGYTEAGRQAMSLDPLSASDSSLSTPDEAGPSPGSARYASLEDLAAAQMRNLAYMERLIQANEESRRRQWKDGIEFLLQAVSEQRRRDMEELLMRIDAVGAGALGEIELTNLRLARLENALLEASAAERGGADDGAGQRR